MNRDDATAAIELSLSEGAVVDVVGGLAVANKLYAQCVTSRDDAGNVTVYSGRALRHGRWLDWCVCLHRDDLDAEGSVRS